MANSDVYELVSGDAPKIMKDEAGQLVSANVTNGTLVLYDGEDATGAIKLTLTSTGPTTESLQSFYFTQLYATLTGGSAYLKIE